MNSKKITVVALVAIVLLFFVLGMNIYQKRVQNSQAQKVSEVVNETRSQSGDQPGAHARANEGPIGMHLTFRNCLQ